MCDRFFHRGFVGVSAQIGSHHMRVDVLKRNDQIRCHEFGGVYQKERSLVPFLFHPKRNDLLKTMHGIADAYAAVGDLEPHKIRWRIGEHAKHCCGNEYQYREEHVVEKYARESG